jgi:hypothetical protein
LIRGNKLPRTKKWGVVMRKMKWTVYLLIIIFSMIVLPRGAFAETAPSFDITSGITGTTGLKIGDTFAVTVTGNNIKDMDAYEAHITFDPDKLAVAPGKAISNIQGGTTNPIIKGNIITLAFAKMGNAKTESGNLSICSITFSVKKAGKVNVTLDSIKLLNGILAERNYQVGKSISASISNAAGTIPGMEQEAATKPVPTAKVTVTGGIPGKTPDTFTAFVNTVDFQKAINSIEHGIILLDMKAPKTAKNIIVNIPAQQIAKAGIEFGDTISINTGTMTISLPPAALKDIIGQKSGNLQIEISAVNVKTLSKPLQKLVAENPVYDFNMNVDGKKVSKFGGGSKAVEIKVNYALKAGKNPENVVTYHINDNGNPEIVKYGLYNSDVHMMAFKTEHFSKYAIVYADTTWNDLKNLASTARSSINALTARGFIAGSNGKFNPGGNIKKAEYIQWLMATLDLTDLNAKSTFTDVKKGTSWYNAIATAQKLGIAGAKKDGSFGLNDSVSRQDAAVWTYKAALLLKTDLKGTGKIVEFTDKAAISPEAVIAVTALHKAGIASPAANNAFSPAGAMTRAQAAEMIYRLYKLGM